MEKLIHENQSGFVKGRFIGENIRMIDDLLNKLKSSNKTGFLLLLDFEKAFDSIEWQYMHTILEKFNFGPSFQNWIKICYTNILSTVINNGFTCGWFSIHRGVRQGCPLSTVLFILCVELLAQLIRANDNIRGIVVGGQEQKISLFADDTTCILKDIESVGRVFGITTEFAKYSGLKLNIEKSILVPIGVRHQVPEIQYPVKLSKDSFNMLGVELGRDVQKCLKANFHNKIEKIKKQMNIWSQRGLTLMGKVLISKSMGISNLIYSMTCLQSQDNVLENAPKIINHFIWNNKPSKIKHKTLIGNYDQGGIRAPDIFTFRQSLRLAWLSRLWYKRVGAL